MYSGASFNSNLVKSIYMHIGDSFNRNLVTYSGASFNSNLVKREYLYSVCTCIVEPLLTAAWLKGNISTLCSVHDSLSQKIGTSALPFHSVKTE